LVVSSQRRFPPHGVPLLQHAAPLVPHVTQRLVFGSSAVPLAHGVPVGHGALPFVPHALHVLLAESHTLPATLHAVPVWQHGPPAVPQSVHVFVSSQTVFAAVQGVPIEQHCWPLPPHARQVLFAPELQDIPELHDPQDAPSVFAGAGHPICCVMPFV
jgi:hypothetical protein